MNKQYASRVLDCSPSPPSGSQKNPTLAGKSRRAVPSLNTGDGLGKERDGMQEDGFDESNYSPREYDPATSGHFDSGEEESHYPTSPRYSRPGSRHAVSDYSPGEEDYDGTSNIGLRKARWPVNRQEPFETDTAAACVDMRPANEGTIQNMASRETPTSHIVEAVDIQPDEGLKPWDPRLRGRNSVTKNHKRKRASAESVQFLITQNQSLSERIEKVEIALALLQDQTGLHGKPQTSLTGSRYLQGQHGSVATEASKTEKTESIVQRERLRLARDVCIVACLVVGIVVLLKLPKLLDAVVGLVDQKTRNLRSEHSANCNAGQ